jgi:hypothetical protein
MTVGASETVTVRPGSEPRLGRRVQVVAARLADGVCSRVDAGRVTVGRITLSGGPGESI